MSKRAAYEHDPAFAIVTGACPHDCPDTCSWQTAVERNSGRAVDMWGCEDHPITQGKLCGKVDRYLERTYHPERLLTPLRRNGPKGSRRFAPVSWEEALSDIADRLQAIVTEYGSEAVLPYSYSGTLGFLQGEGMASRFFNRLGASRLARTICAEAGYEGFVYTIGATEGMEMDAFAHSRLILIWGSNTLTSNLHLWPFIAAARKKGARVIVIDPLRTRTAQAGDEWLPILPGTDGALALAMMHVIVAEELYDADYVTRHAIGFEQLAQRVLEWTPDRAAALTGVSAERIRSLARDYAATQPAAIRINYGMQRHAGGGMAMRTIACLPALVGAWRYEGGGIQLSASGYFRHMERSNLLGADLLGLSPWARSPRAARGAPRTINMNRLGDALSLDPARLALAHYRPRPIDPLPAAHEDLIGPPVKALVVYNANPAAVTPNQAAVIAGLGRSDLFTVVLEHFQTDTADWADYVLPATTQLEHWDLHKAYGHTYLALNRPAIAPVGESLPNSEIFRRLALRMGFQEPCFTESDEEILRALVEAQVHPRFAGITWDRLLREGFVRLNLPQPNLPFAEGNFPTPSGKCEFYSARMAQDGYDPLPTYHPPRWQEQVSHVDETNGNGASSANTKPLACISPPAHSFLNSTFSNMERFLRREGQPTLYIHGQDAAARSIQDGDTVEVRNKLGCVRLTARLTEGVAPGVVAAAGVWWPKLSPDQRNINQTTLPDEADMGAGALFYDSLVEATPCSG